MVKIEFGNSNEVNIRGSEYFLTNALQMLHPLFNAYKLAGEARTGDVNVEPIDPERLRVEIKMVVEATESNQPFKGKYASYQPDETANAGAATGGSSDG